MSRKKSERTPRRYRRKPEVKKTKTEIPTAVDVDLRTARPVRRLAGQVRVHAESLRTVVRRSRLGLSLAVRTLSQIPLSSRPMEPSSTWWRAFRSSSRP